MPFRRAPEARGHRPFRRVCLHFPKEGTCGSTGFRRRRASHRIRARPPLDPGGAPATALHSCGGTALQLVPKAARSSPSRCPRSNSRAGGTRIVFDTYKYLLFFSLFFLAYHLLYRSFRAQNVLILI